jgi:hypothetical protein
VDYVIFGIGMGASLVLFGLGSRTVGPSLRYRQSASSGEVLRADQLVAKIAWGRFCGSLGVTIAIGGVFLLIVTGLAMVLRLSDRTATISVVVAVLLVVVLMVVWAWAFVNRFGLYGIVTEREMKARRPVFADDAPPADEPEPETSTDAAPEPAGPPPVVTATRRIPAQPTPQQQPQPATQPASPQVPDGARPFRPVAANPAPAAGTTNPAPAPQPDSARPVNRQPANQEPPVRETSEPGMPPAPSQPEPARQPDVADEETTGSVAPGPTGTAEEPLDAATSPDSAADDAAALERILNSSDEELRGPHNR